MVIKVGKETVENSTDGPEEFILFKKNRIHF